MTTTAAVPVIEARVLNTGFSIQYPGASIQESECPQQRAMPVIEARLLNTVFSI